MCLQQSLKKMNPHSAEQMNSQNGLLHTHNTNLQCLTPT
jgi:hypothetical protein